MDNIANCLAVACAVGKNRFFRGFQWFLSVITERAGILLSIFAVTMKVGEKGPEVLFIKLFLADFWCIKEKGRYE